MQRKLRISKPSFKKKICQLVCLLELHIKTFQKCITGIDILISRIMMSVLCPAECRLLWWEGQVKATNTTSIQENGQTEAVLHFSKNCQDQCHHQGLEGCRGGDSYHILICCTCLTCVEDRQILENDKDYYHLNQVVPTVVATVPDVVSLLEQ